MYSSPTYSSPTENGPTRRSPMKNGPTGVAVMANPQWAVSGPKGSARHLGTNVVEAGL